MPRSSPMPTHRRPDPGRPGCPPATYCGIARYLKAVGDRRKVVRDAQARYWGGRVEERSLVPLGEARLGRIGLDEWLRHSRAGA